VVRTRGARATVTTLPPARTEVKSSWAIPATKMWGHLTHFFRSCTSPEAQTTPPNDPTAGGSETRPYRRTGNGIAGSHGRLPLHLDTDNAGTPHLIRCTSGTRLGQAATFAPMARGLPHTVTGCTSVQREALFAHEADAGVNCIGIEQRTAVTLQLGKCRCNAQSRPVRAVR